MRLYNGLRIMDHVTVDEEEDTYIVIDIYDMDNRAYCKLQNKKTSQIIDQNVQNVIKRKNEYSISIREYDKIKQKNKHQIS